MTTWSRPNFTPACFPGRGFFCSARSALATRLILGVFGMEGRSLSEQVADEVVQARAIVVCSVILSATRW
jgi:hypothetical protein